MNVLLVSLVFLRCVSAWAATPLVTAAPDLLIRSVKIIDGSGSAAYGPTDISIANGKIVAIGAATGPAFRTLDGSGKILIPGLIDCHSHLPSVPGALFRKESEEAQRGQRLRQLKSYLAAGITSVLDAATPPSLVQSIEEFRKANVLPRVLFLAPFLTPSGGYFSTPEDRQDAFADLWPPVSRPEEIGPLFAQAASLHPLGAKITEEYGLGPTHVWPVFSEVMLGEIAAKAEEFHAPIFVHAEREQEFKNALKAKPYAFMHAGFFDESPDPEFLRTLKDSGAYVVSTLAIFKLMNLMWDKSLFQDPWFQLLVPEEQRATALSPEVTDEVVRRLAVRNKPSFAPSFLAKALAPLFVNQKETTKELLSSERAVKQMFDAGIPIVMGADEGNWPVLPTMFHGVGGILELEALAEAGLPSLEVIHAATGRAAQMLKIAGEVGTVTVGKNADLVLLNADPTQDPLAFRKVAYVVKDGNAKTPAEWIR